MRCYIDASPLIYLVQKVEGYFDRVRDFLAEEGIDQISSDLTRLECSVKPMRDKDETLLQEFSDYFEQAIAEIVPLGRSVMERAARIRAQYGFKTPDAIHLAAAIEANCDVFLTNDHRLDRFPEIRIEVIGNAGAA